MRSWRSLSILVFEQLFTVSAPASEFAAVNITPSPDTLIRFDTHSPATAFEKMAVLAGNFVRGLDLVSRTEGWYVCTSSSDGTPTGLFHLLNGVSTLVAPLPFNAGAPGGMTLDADNEALYVALDPPGSQAVTLYLVDFSGHFTEIGPITLAGASPEISGLAADPISGNLYAIDNTTDSLLLINPMTGAATRVGAGLGVPADAVGGADFDGNGVLVIATGIGSVYEVNTTNGVAGPLLGQLPFRTSSIAWIPCNNVCLGDLNADFFVNESDLGILLQAWQQTAVGDLDCDGATDETDLGILLQHWLTSCGE
ncbi:MAG: hypothetical protein U1D55_13640 [Phycisphaerae bacterium]